MSRPVTCGNCGSRTTLSNLIHCDYCSTECCDDCIANHEDDCADDDDEVEEGMGADDD